jgi:hypothetical protein
MSERDPGERRPANRLWFLSDRDAFLRRFILRTLLQPPRSARALQALRGGWARR